MGEQKQSKIVDDFSDDDKVNNGNFFAFSTETPKVIGILKGFKDSEYGRVAQLDDGSGELIDIGSFTALKTKLTEDMIGKAVKIVYNGEIRSKTGRMYKDFSVYCKE